MVFYQFFISLIIDEAWPSEMQPVWGSSAIADEVETKFAISAFHAVIYLTFRHIHFTHNNFKMPNQGFHLGIHILFRRKIIFRNLCMIYFCFCTFEFLNFPVSLSDNFKRLLHFLITYQEPVVTVAGSSYRDIKIKIFVA